MKTLIIISMLFFGLSVYTQNTVPVEPFSGNWPTQGTALKSAQSNPFDDINDNPDPDPVPIGDSLGMLIILGLTYATLRHKKKAH